MATGILALVSVAVNALAAIFAPLVARKLASQREKLRVAEETAGLLGTGLGIVERAVEENKDALSRTGAGDRVVRTIRAYGPMAKDLVDTARLAAKQLRESAEAVEAEAEVEAAGQEVERHEREQATPAGH